MEKESIKEKKLVHLDHHKETVDPNEIMYEMAEAPTPVMEQENQSHFINKTIAYQEKKLRSIA